MRTRSDTKRPAESKRKELSRKQTQKADEERRNTTLVQHEARIRTPVRTPKLKSPHCKNIAQTPGRDDVLCSQHFDSQVVVGWDCNSPDTLRGIKRISGSEQHDDVSDLVMRLIGENDSDDILTKRSTPPLLGVWREDQEDKLLDDKTVISHRLRRNRTRQRKKSGKDSSVSKDLLNKLSIALDKCNEEVEEEVDEDEKETVTEIFLPGDEVASKHNISVDLFSSESNNNDEVQKPRASARLLEKENEERVDKKSSEKIGDIIEGIKELDEDTWSDDELFEEDSFIVKATQVSCDTKKFVSPVFGVKRKTSSDSALPKSKCSRYTFQIGGDDEKDIESRSANFTSLQNKQAVSSSDMTSGNVYNVTKYQTYGKVTMVTAASSKSCSTVTNSASRTVRSNTVTSSSYNKPPIYPVTSYSNATGNSLNVKKSVQALNSCADPGLGRNMASEASSIAINRQRGNLYAVGNNCTGQQASKPLNRQSTGAISNASFKKHSSFSGTDSLNLVSDTSRRRSVSGDNCLFNNANIKQGTAAVLKSSDNKSSTSSVSSITSKLYPSASRNSVATSSKPVLSSNKSNTFQLGRMDAAATSGNAVNSSSRSKSFCDSSSKLQYGAKTSVQSVYTDKNVDQNKAIQIPKNTELPGEGGNERRCSVGAFDTSLTDDLLCQLAEPDDILDSQAVFNVTVTSVSHIPKTTSSALSKPLSIKPSNFLPSTSSCHVTSTTGTVAASCQDTGLRTVNCKQSAKQFKFKPSQRKSESPTGNKECVVNNRNSTMAVGNSAKTKGPTVEQYSEDLFASDDEDDMLLADDDGLTEPQILAMLDEVELMASQRNCQISKPVPCMEVKGTAVEKKPTVNQNSELQSCQGQSVERNRASDHGTDLQGSQGQLAGSQGQLAGSQGQSSSQTKYSPEEIERKKQEAIERRKRKLKKV